MQSETGNAEFKYEMACTEICGRGHFAMRYVVVVDEPEDYETWLGEQKAFASQNPDLVAKFQKAAAQKPAAKMEASAEVH